MYLLRQLRNAEAKNENKIKVIIDEYDDVGADVCEDQRELSFSWEKGEVLVNDGYNSAFKIDVGVREREYLIAEMILTVAEKVLGVDIPRGPDYARAALLVVAHKNPIASAIIQVAAERIYA